METGKTTEIKNYVRTCIEAYDAALVRGEGDPYIHAATKIYNVAYEDVTSQQRWAMKTILFAHIYGRA